MRLTITCLAHGVRVRVYASEVEGARLMLREPVVRRAYKACRACTTDVSAHRDAPLRQRVKRARQALADERLITDSRARVWVAYSALATGALVLALKVSA